MMVKYSFIAVDLQNDFAEESGAFFIHGQWKNFLKGILFPFIKKVNVKVNEIISDYRQPRPGDRRDCCHPGKWGYDSIVPKEIVKSTWIKSMNSPVWVRENIGRPDKAPGWPYPDPVSFGDWLKENIGVPEVTVPVVFGLTIDCCVLSTLQELSWRGYYPLVIKEGVAHSSGKISDRDSILKSPIPNWSEIVTFDELKKKLT